jgi:hypothetical protein
VKDERILNDLLGIELNDLLGLFVKDERILNDLLGTYKRYCNSLKISVNIMLD